jgi:hypothetical protein
MMAWEQVIRSAKRTARVAGILALAVLLMDLMRAAVHSSSGWRFDALGAVRAAVTVGVVWFAVFFLWALIDEHRIAPLLEALDEEPGELLPQPLTAFVAMEYFCLILNRTFVVFVAPEGVYAWKASGPATCANREYFKPYEEMLADDEFLRDKNAIENLSHLPGGFFLARAQIASIVSDERQKWGMGGIAHAGRIHLRLNSGKQRELILLGAQIPGDVRDRMAATLGVPGTSRQPADAQQENGR